MAVKEPSWWYGAGPHWQTAALAPIAQIYGAIAERRYRQTTATRSAFPVLCAGNFTAGGTGKTPLALELAAIVREHGGTPWFLSRGYGGRLDGQERVDPERHTAAEVGDEPLLLAQSAPTVISRDRGRGAEFIARQAKPGSVIILDDGLQNPSLAKDLSIAVIDAVRGFGNGAVMPAGPLRAPLAFQAGLATALLVNTTSLATTHRATLALPPELAHLPVLHARAAPSGDVMWLTGARMVAFAGIANPARFFDLLRSYGATLIETIAFADHQALTDTDARHLLDLAQRHGCQLLTTEKDAMRLAGSSGALAELSTRATTLPITLQFENDDRQRLSDLVANALARRRV